MTLINKYLEPFEYHGLYIWVFHILKTDSFILNTSLDSTYNFCSWDNDNLHLDLNHASSCRNNTPTDTLNGLPIGSEYHKTERTLNYGNFQDSEIA